MADHSAILPSQDDLFDPDDELNLLNIDFDILSDLPSFDDPNSDPHSIPPPANTNEIAGPSDPVNDPNLKLSNVYPSTESQAGPSEFQAGPSHSEQQNLNPEPWQPLLNWPPAPVPYSCSCCQVLREIIHSYEDNVTKLEVHGRVGIICHAILEIRYNVASNSSMPVYQMIDFCKSSTEMGKGGAKSVKKYLTEYCNERKQAGFVMVQDPLSYFYEAMCVGFDFDGNDLSSSTSKDDEEDEDLDSERVLKIPLTEQRARAKKLTLDDFRQYFHIPINKAADELRICSTVIKKACRRFGISRWPYRRINSLSIKLSKQKSKMNEALGEERAQCQAKIDEHQRLINAEYYLSI